MTIVGSAQIWWTFSLSPPSSIKLYAGNLDLSVVSKGHQEKRGIASKAKKWFLELETEMESSSISGKHYRLIDFEAKTEVICFTIFKEIGPTTLGHL